MHALCRFFRLCASLMFFFSLTAFAQGTAGQNATKLASNVPAPEEHFSTKPEKDGILKIGVIVSLTGSQATYGKDAVDGLNLALQQMGDDAKKIKLFIHDSQSKPSDAADAANKLIQSDKVSVIIGDMTSSGTLAAAGIAESSHIPLISPAATNPAVTAGKKYIFRSCFIDSFQGFAMADFAIKDLNAKTVVILEDSDSDYSRGLAASFKEFFIKGGGKVLDSLSYSQRDTVYDSLLVKIKRMNPSVVFIPGYPQQVGPILKRMKDYQIKAKVMGGDGWDSPDMKTLAKGAEVGGYFSNHYSAYSTEPRTVAFVEAYKKKYNGVIPTNFAALAYDTLGLVLKAAQGTNGNPEQITKNLSQIKNFQGVTGEITINKNHDSEKPAVILEYTSTGYKYVKSVSN